MSEKLLTLNTLKSSLSGLKAYVDKKFSRLKNPDWTQNDEAASDYIKNRICYTKDPVDITVIEETTVSEFVEFDDNNYCDSSSLFFLENGLIYNLVEGEKYTVIYDGTEYTDLVCFIDETYSFPTIGAPIGDYSTYSFSIIFPHTNTYMVYASLYVTISASEFSEENTTVSHTVKIIGKYQEPVTIDDKYIPDTVVRQEELSVIQSQLAYKANTRDLANHTSALTYKGFSYSTASAYGKFAYFLTEDGLYLLQTNTIFDSGHYKLMYDSSAGTLTAYISQNNQLEVSTSYYSSFCLTLYDVNTGKRKKNIGTNIYTATIGQFTKSAGNFMMYKDRLFFELKSVHSFDDSLPIVSEADNGKILQVVNGKWTEVELSTEDWTMELEDGTTVTKKVVVLS